MPSKEFLDSDVHLGDTRRRGTPYWSKCYNQFHDPKTFKPILIFSRLLS